jgi:hypothetical protein
MAPDLRSHVHSAVVTAEEGPAEGRGGGHQSLQRGGAASEGVETVFICATRAVERMMAADALPSQLSRHIDAEILSGHRTLKPSRRAPGRRSRRTSTPSNCRASAFPERRTCFWSTARRAILALMPNGLGYVHNAVKKGGINFETFDLDIVTYHRYHIRRLFDEGGKDRHGLAAVKCRPIPWQAENYDLWENPELLAYLSPIVEEAAAAIVKAKPKVLGLSIQQCNTAFSHLLVKHVKDALPDYAAPGRRFFSCYNADIGLRAFPEADYMCIGESDLTVGPLVKQLVAGERPKDLPGVRVAVRHAGPAVRAGADAAQSRSARFPRYEWVDLSIYRNFNGYQLVPVIASRGCRWSRCTFCAERFYWRIQLGAEFRQRARMAGRPRLHAVHVQRKRSQRHAGKADLEICDEIIRRDIRVRLTGQLRIQKTSDGAFYDRLHERGFRRAAVRRRRVLREHAAPAEEGLHGGHGPPESQGLLGRGDLHRGQLGDRRARRNRRRLR